MITRGDSIDRYVVEGELGRGGMASVYRVRHASLGSDHALKILHNVRNPKIRERLLREGRVQARLRHVNIVAVTDLVEIGGEVGLVLEYVPGESLAETLNRGRMDPAEAVRIFRGVVAGVQRAHEAGLVHRDLKPANVLMDRTVIPAIPKVADFGLALVTEESRITQSGNAMGTIPYMAPEQFLDAKNVDARADVYALAVMLYEMMTGELPFEGRDMFAVLEAKRMGAYRPLSGAGSTLPGLALLIRHGLAPDPAARIPDCATLAGLIDGTIDEAELRRRIAQLGPGVGITLPPGRRPAEPTIDSTPPPESLEAPSVPSRSALSGTFDAPRAPATRVILAVLALGAGGLVLVAMAGAVVWGVSRYAGKPVEVASADQPVPQDPAPVVAVAPAPDLPTPSSTPALTPAGEAAAPAASPAPKSSGQPIKSPRAVTPVIAPKEAASPAPSASGRVSVSGVAEAWLVSATDGSRPSLTKAPPGSYQVYARWSAGDDAFRVRKLTLAAGESVTITCDATVRMCE